MVQVTLSPYDIPEAVRSFHDDVSDKWSIEFRYFGDQENLKPLPPRNGVSMKSAKTAGASIASKSMTQAGLAASTCT